MCRCRFAWFGYLWVMDQPTAYAPSYLGLGSNIGDRRGHLVCAVAAIRAFAPIRGISRVYETEPVGFDAQDPFLNVVLCIEAACSPESLLRRVKAIEADVGRSPTFRNGPREIDIDVLLCGELQLSGEALHLPHPRMTVRAFVLRPLADLAPDLVVPGTGRTVREILETGGPWERAEPLFEGGQLLDATGHQEDR